MQIALRKSVTVKLLLLIISLLPFSAHALSLDWPKCVQLAQENNAEIAAARAALEKARYQERAVLSAMFPDLNGSLSFSETQSREPGQFGAGLSAKQNLFNGLQDISRYRQAQARTRSAEANLRIITVRISKELKAAYAALRYAEEYLRLADEIVERRRSNARLVKIRFESGRENKGNVMLSAANVEQAELEQLQARNARRIAEVQLAKALGMDETEGSIELKGDVPLTEGTATPNFRELVKKTPEYIQAEADEQATERDVDINRGRFMPTLELNGSAGINDTKFFPAEQGYWTAGVVLSIPLFAGGENYNSFRAAVEGRTAARFNTYNTRRTLLTKLEEMFAIHTEAVARLKVNTRFLEADALRAKIGRGKYGNNLLSFEDWDKIENEFIDRQKNLLTSKRDRATAEANWEQAQGKGALK